MFETILYEKDEQGIAWVTLNRPERLNAYSVQMRDDLYEVVSAIGDDPDVRVTIFRGAGRAFCAGADLTEFGTAPSPVIARQVRWERDLWGLLLGLDKPLIAAIHGYCLGSGLELAMCCDFRVASQDAQLGLPEVGLGIIPAAGGSQTLPRLVGPGKALELVLLGERIDAQEAYRIGLVHRVVPREELEAAAAELASKLLKQDPLVLGLAKQAVTRGQDLPLAEGLRLEAQLGALTRGRGKGKATRKGQIASSKRGPRRRKAEIWKNPEVQKLLGQPFGTPIDLSALTPEELRALVEAAYGSRPDLPPGEEYTQQIRRGWGRRLRDLYHA